LSREYNWVAAPVRAKYAAISSGGLYLAVQEVLAAALELREPVCLPFAGVLHSPPDGRALLSRGLQTERSVR
jgi:hypothetical protein